MIYKSRIKLAMLLNKPNNPVKKSINQQTNTSIVANEKPPPLSTTL